MARLESIVTAVLVNWYQLNTNSTLWTLLILSCLHITLLNAISKHYSYNTFPKPLWPAVLPMQSSPVETSLQASAHKPPDDCVICELALVRHYKTHIHMQTCSTSTITGTETLDLVISGFSSHHKCCPPSSMINSCLQYNVYSTWLSVLQMKTTNKIFLTDHYLTTVTTFI